MLDNNIGDGTTNYFCSALSIEKELLYSYIKEINNFFADTLCIIGYDANVYIEYDFSKKRYFLVK